MSPGTKQGPEARPEGEVLTGRERRRNPRVAAPWPAVVESSDGRLVTGEVIDVSLSGMKLRVNADVTVGDAVKLRVTLPREAGELEISAEVVRRDPGGIGVDFGKLPPEDLQKVKIFVPTWDLRRRAERVGVELPVEIRGHDASTVGRTVDLSAVGARVATDDRLTPGDMVAVLLTPTDGKGAMRIQAVVWEVDARGAVLVFANLTVSDFVRLRAFVDSLLVKRS
ncbi:MAG TPA: PilZ domain-containing protein [Thermoanaerobaculia bacterium]|nr:PilZ domain-containing protein [Thermoanaerobaculia bacterium]